jgi:hypothetical protein
LKKILKNCTEAFDLIKYSVKKSIVQQLSQEKSATSNVHLVKEKLSLDADKIQEEENNEEKDKEGDEQEKGEEEEKQEEEDKAEKEEEGEKDE